MSPHPELFWHVYHTHTWTNTHTGMDVYIMCVCLVRGWRGSPSPPPRWMSNRRERLPGALGVLGRQASLTAGHGVDGDKQKRTCPSPPALSPLHFPPQWHRERDSRSRLHRARESEILYSVRSSFISSTERCTDINWERGLCRSGRFAGPSILGEGKGGGENEWLYFLWMQCLSLRVTNMWMDKNKALLDFLNYKYPNKK